MTIEEKMEHFKNVSLENAAAQSESILSAYKQSLDEQFEKHKETAVSDAESIVGAKLNAVRLDAKRELAKAQSEVRRGVTLHQNKLKAQIFSEVLNKLDEYKKTEKYKAALVSQIKSIMKDFSDTSIEFYIDSSDSDLQKSIIAETGADIKLSSVSFIGGCKAVITSQNILIDNSFKTKLADEQDQFTISF